MTDILLTSYDLLTCSSLPQKKKKREEEVGLLPSPWMDELKRNIFSN